MKQMRHKINSGFTLIELLTVISIIGLLSSVVLTSLSSARDRARVATGQAYSTQLYRGFSADGGAFFSFDEAAGDSLDAQNGLTCVMGGNITRSSDTPSRTGFSIRQEDGFGDNCSVAVGGTSLVGSTDEGRRFTFSMWYKPRGLPQDLYDAYVFNRSGFHTGIVVRKSNNKTLGVLWYEDNTNVGIGDGPAMSTDKWYHIALAVDSVSNVAELFVDGKSYGQATLTKNLKNYGSSAFAVGGIGNYGGYGFIDDARFYFHAFRLADAERVYAEGLKKNQFAGK